MALGHLAVFSHGQVPDKWFIKNSVTTPIIRATRRWSSEFDIETESVLCGFVLR
jgi:hypothetical protein